MDRNKNRNIVIDIEIDEPYEAIGRKATHYKGNDEDTRRNYFFNERGWIVIRFSERQVHKFPNESCRLIADVIKSISPEFNIPTPLLNYSKVQDEPFWTKAQAENWAAINERENYLGIPNFERKTKYKVDTTNLIQNENENEVEKEITSSYVSPPIIQRHWNEENEHPRDDRIKFHSDTHTYFINGNPSAISATTLVKMFFGDFDIEAAAQYVANQDGTTIDQAKEKFLQAARDGVALHNDIENYFENRTIPQGKPEFNHFLNLFEQKLKYLEIYRTEWRIFDAFHYVAGTADMLFRIEDNKFALYDWKRSKRINIVEPHLPWAKFGIGPCQDITDCNYNQYSLQLNIYKKIIEDYYPPIKISEMCIVQIHPSKPNYSIHPVTDLSETVEQMFQELTTE